MDVKYSLEKGRPLDIMFWCVMPALIAGIVLYAAVEIWVKQ